MEYLAPPLECAMLLRAAIENGESVRTGVTKYCQKSQNRFSEDLVRLIVAFESGSETSSVIRSQKSIYRAALMDLILAGFNGQSILDRLRTLQDELIVVCKAELQKQVDLLPFQMMIPLLLFQFPAFLLLLLGPVLADLLRKLS